MINNTNHNKVLDKNTKELFRLICEGYIEIQDGKISTINEVRENLIKMRKERVKGCN